MRLISTTKTGSQTSGEHGDSVTVSRYLRSNANFQWTSVADVQNSAKKRPCMVSGGVWQDLQHKLVCAASVDGGTRSNNGYYIGWTTLQTFPSCTIGRFG